VLPLVLLLLAGALAWAGWEVLSYQFGKEASTFDLSQMESMEAASVIYDRTGNEMAKIFIQNRNPVPYEKINPRMIEAVIAAEDNRFLKHKGVDWAGIMRAAIANYRSGRITQGASTVTQQLARNSFDLRERTYRRKILEIFLAGRIEQMLSKQDIMRLYLNRVYFGSGFYGVESAAMGYFGVSAADLDIGHSAMLAGLLKSPQSLSPWNNPDAALAARDFVLHRMREQGFISRARLREELSKPLEVVPRSSPFKISHAVELIRQQAIEALGFDRAMNGGFHITSTIDGTIQKAAEDAVRQHLEAIESMPGYSHETFREFKERVRSIEEKIDRGNMSVKMPVPKYLQAAALALDSRTGAILAMIGGREFKHNEYNRATQARRPIGTAFTPFVFATAFEGGIFPGEIVEDACIDNRYVMVGGESGILGEWGVERPDNEYEGPMPMRVALAKGKNAAAVRIGLRTGLEALAKTTAAAGITSPLRRFANAFLGSSEMTLEETTLAFTIFGSGGQRPETVFIIEKIADRDGHVVFQHTPSRVQAITPEAAYQTHSALEDALHLGTGAVSSSLGLGGFPSAGKTGTAYNFTDTYFFGYTSSVTCGVWVGFDRPTRIFRGAFGKDLPLPVWVRIMNAAAKVLPAEPFKRPETLEAVEICRSSGLLATPKCHTTSYDAASGTHIQLPTTYSEWATKDQIPKIACDVHGPGIRSFVRQYEEEQWPRALDPVDVSRIRPIAVNAPTLIGLTDVYGSIRPGSGPIDDAIPVARAVAANTSAPSPILLGDEPGDESSDEPEIRKAEPAGPADSLLEPPAVAAPTPEPIRF
jgi:membrane carboxypeptidase/penicillin-binding protein